ncbi:hypothetical protein B0H21DRAFT_711529 [Amylocystis lapponica]|nr:hypothetical protein B0H21DRAFT_711529 [Amylocystis lapponica]
MLQTHLCQLVVCALVFLSCPPQCHLLMSGRPRRTAASKGKNTSAPDIATQPAQQKRGKGRPPKSTVTTATSNLPTEIDDGVPVSSEDVTPGTRRYATRATNDPHPAITAGLGKRTQEEISVDATRKREEKELLIMEKKAQLQAQADETQRAIEELAKYERELASMDSQEQFSKLLEDEENSQVAVNDEPLHNMDSDISPDMLMSKEDLNDDSHISEESETEAQTETAVVGEKRKAAAQSQKGKKKTKKDQRQELLAAIEDAKKGQRVADIEAGTVECVKPLVRTLKIPTKTATSVTATTTKSTATNSPVAARLSTSLSSSSKPLTMGLKPNWRTEICAASRFSSPSSSTPTYRPFEAVGVSTTMVVIDEDNLDGGKSGLASDLLEIMGKRRAPKTAVPDGQSLSFDSLPSWAQSEWKVTFIPTLLDIVGSQENPWGVNGNSDSNANLLGLVQALIDAIYPEAHEELDQKSKVFRIARQAVSDWRRNFVKAAHAAVKKDLESRGGKKQIQDFTRPVLCNHGSQADEKLADAPRGAIALAVTACVLNSIFYNDSNESLKVEHEFSMWRDGSYRQGKQFREDTVGAITLRWASGSVNPCWEATSTRAYTEIAAKHTEKKRSTIEQRDDDRELVVDRSSPAPGSED